MAMARSPAHARWRHALMASQWRSATRPPRCVRSACARRCSCWKACSRPPSCARRRANDGGSWSTTQQQIEMIERCAITAAGLDVWLKIDSGMHRCGFDASAARPAYERLNGSGKVRSITLMSHFARADEPECGFTARADRALRPCDRRLARAAQPRQLRRHPLLAARSPRLEPLWHRPVRRRAARLQRRALGTAPGDELFAAKSSQCAKSAPASRSAMAAASSRPGQPVWASSHSAMPTATRAALATARPSRWTGERRRSSVACRWTC